jgi:hypothetical protein
VVCSVAFLILILDLVVRIVVLALQALCWFFWFYWPSQSLCFGVASLGEAFSWFCLTDFGWFVVVVDLLCDCCIDACLGWCVGWGRNLVLFFPAFAWFCYFIAIVSLVFSWFWLFCWVAEMISLGHFAWFLPGDVKARVRIRFRLCLTLLDFCYFFGNGMGLGWCVGKGRNLVQTLLDLAVFLLCYGSGVGLFRLRIAIAMLDLVRPLEAYLIIYPCLDCRSLWWCLVNRDNETPREYVFIRDNEKPSSNGWEGGGDLTYDDPGYPYPWLWCFLVYCVSYPWLPYHGLEGRFFCPRLAYHIVVLTIMVLILVFCLFSSFFPYRSLDLLFPYPYPYPYPYPCLAWRRAKTSFRLGCVLLDFCFFCVFLPLILSRIAPGQRTKPRSDLAWLCLICAFFWLWYCLISCVAKGENLVQTRLDFAWFCLIFAILLLMWPLISCVAKGENLVLTWLDFPCFLLFLLWYCLISCIAKGENLVQTCLDFAWLCLIFAIVSLM